MFKHIKKFFKGRLHSACFNGRIEAVKRHLDAGEDVDEIDGGRTPLHVACLSGGHKEIVELLIANGADVNTNDSGGTPLHHAATKEIAELLIAKGADVNAKDDKGTTPLDWTILFGQPETAYLLRKHGGKTSEELKAEGK